MREAAGGAQVEIVIGHGEQAFDGAAQVLERLRGLDIPALVVPSGLSLSPDGAVRAKVPELGERVGDIAAGRAGLSAGECVWWGSEVARILAELHRHGIVHGQLDASNVVVTRRGVMLLALPAAPDVAPDVAPWTVPDAEPSTVPDAEPGAGPLAADDVEALGRALDATVCAADAMLVRAWTEPMRDQNPGARPSAAMVAHALRSCAEPVPIGSVEPPIASRLRGRWCAMREASEGAGHGTTVPGGAARGIGKARESTSSEAAPVKSAPVALPEARWWRFGRWLRSIPRLPRLPATRVAVATALVVACVVLGALGVAAAAGEAGHRPGPAVLMSAREGTPVGAARGYVAGRLCTLAGGPEQAWLEGIAPGSDAATEASARIAERDAGALSVVPIGGGDGADAEAGDGGAGERGAAPVATGGGMGCGLIEAPMAVTQVERLADDAAAVVIEVPTAAHRATTAQGSTEYPQGLLVMELRLRRHADGRWRVESAGAAA